MAEQESGHGATGPNGTRFYQWILGILATVFILIVSYIWATLDSRVTRTEDDLRNLHRTVTDAVRANFQEKFKAIDVRDDRQDLIDWERQKEVERFRAFVTEQQTVHEQTQRVLMDHDKRVRDLERSMDRYLDRQDSRRQPP